MDIITNHSIQWNFIPPTTPYFRGLWETVVKSTKDHLLKVIKGVLLSFEEMNTLL